LQAGGHRFDPGWLHSPKRLHAPEVGHGAALTVRGVTRWCPNATTEVEELLAELEPATGTRRGDPQIRETAAVALVEFADYTPSLRCCSRCAVEVQEEARLGSTEEAAGSIPADRLDAVIARPPALNDGASCGDGCVASWPVAAGSGTTRRRERVRGPAVPEGTAGPRFVRC
jgi:hypothetical protein